jgi:hypothetical protein
MGNILTSTQIKKYKQDGFHFPLDVFTRDEAALLLKKLEEIERSFHAGRIPPIFNLKAHLLNPWLWDVVHNEHILNTVEAIMGPNLLCWASGFFIKEPGNPTYAAWHQDISYWGLSEPKAITVWLAFTESTPENGCMKFLRSGPKHSLKHEYANDFNNMLAGGEKISLDINPKFEVEAILSPGQASLHDGHTIHGSNQNLSQSRRVGYVIRYIAADIKQIGNKKGSATLAKGRDFGFFELEKKPNGEFLIEDIEYHNKIYKDWGRMIGENSKIFQEKFN